MEAPLLHSLSEQAKLGSSPWAGPQGSTWAEATSSPWPDEEQPASSPRVQVGENAMLMHNATAGLAARLSWSSG